MKKQLLSLIAAGVLLSSVAVQAAPATFSAQQLLDCLPVDLTDQERCAVVNGVFPNTCFVQISPVPGPVLGRNPNHSVPAIRLFNAFNNVGIFEDPCSALASTLSCLGLAEIPDKSARHVCPDLYN